MEIKVNKINSYTRELTINLSWNECIQDFQQTVKKFSKKVRLPGFRPGKIPTKVLMKIFMPNIETPMNDKKGVRSLNLSVACGIATYEAFKQINFS